MGPADCSKRLASSNVPVSYFFEGGADGPFKSPSGLSPSYVDDFVASQDGLRLKKAFMRVRPALQRRIVALVNEIAGDDGASSP